MSNQQLLVWQFGLAFFILACWQAASGRLVDNFFISNPLDVAVRLWEWTITGYIFPHLWVTFYETIAGFVLGSLIGALLGIWLGVSHFMSRLLNPFLFAFYALPKIALAPLLVLWFGLGLESKIALSTVIVFFLVFYNTFTGVREVDQDMIDTVRLMKARPYQVLIHVVIPSAMSWIFAGLKISVPYALIGAIVGELIAANQGLGYLVQRMGADFDTTGVFAVLVVIGLLAIVLNHIVEVIQVRQQRWKIISH
ncbi:MAG: ABC transporter permease [Pseudolabrys sp.]|jgi:NitT/TauT family transport system permease protein|nr:ABC transporter permease [Pseudolabrys sp.]